MKATINIPDELATAFNTRFGFAQQNELNAEDFFIKTIGSYIKAEASQHIQAEAAAAASKTASGAVEDLEITKDV